MTPKINKDVKEEISVTFSIPKELHERAVKKAAQTERSLAGLCRWALMHYVNEGGDE